MPKYVKPMSALVVSKISDAGLHAVGGAQGLYLLVAKSGARRWVYRVSQNGRRSDLGMGSYPDVSLVEAREAVLALRKEQREGVDVAQARRDEKKQKRADMVALSKLSKEAQIPNFEDYAVSWIELNSKRWKNPKHAQQWKNTLLTYAYPVIGKLAVDVIETPHILKVLQPIWHVKTETAQRVMQRIRRVLDAATAEGLRSGNNPAKWADHLCNILPAPSEIAEVKHHPAVPIDEMPKLMAILVGKTGYSNWALQLLILTAARTQEIILMQRHEIDWGKGIWSVPTTAMKMKRSHRVPLPKQALELCRVVPVLSGSTLMFPSMRSGKPMSNNALPKALAEAGYGDYTVHGLRSSFRDWAAERTSYPRDLAEMALSHLVKDKTEAAYRRGDMLERRREMMADWADFCFSHL